MFGTILLKTNDNFIQRKSILAATNVEKTLETPMDIPAYNQYLFSLTKKKKIQAKTNVRTVEYDLFKAFSFTTKK